MVWTKALLHKLIVLTAIIGMTNSLTAPPILACTNKYVNTATYTFNMAPYFNTSNTVLNPYIYTATFPTLYTNTDYHIGLSIQQMKYIIANRIMNYTLWADVKSPGSMEVLLYTNTANKIQTLVIYLMTISPGFQDYYFSEQWLPIDTILANGQIYTITVPDGPYNKVGSMFIWSTLLGVDAKAGSNANEIGLQLSVLVKTSNSVKITITAVTSVPFLLNSVTINYFVFNNGDLMASSQASYTWGEFSGTNPAIPLSAPDALGYIRIYNTIVGITGFHIADDVFFQYQCNTSNPFSVTATSENQWTLMAFDYVYLRFTYCADTTPFLMVATNLCYDICPMRYCSHTIAFQCKVCPTYDCYYCGNNGKCSQCNATLDFRVMNNVTNRCIPLDGYYDNGVSQAVPCVAANCLTCTSATVCVSCYSGKFLRPNKTCTDCIPNCLNCTTTINCQLCQTSYIFVSPNCILDCSPVANCSTCSLNNVTIQCISCQTGYSLVANACVTVCGDGIVVSPQQCDDGTTTGLNGCASNCTIQSTYFCVNSPSSCTSCLPYCTTCTNASVCITCFTNYTYTAGACTIDCTSISNCSTCNYTSNINCMTCLTGFNLSSNTCSSVCGDAILVSSEQCDDGNPTNLDGCSSTCTIQPGFFCTGAINSTSTCFGCSPFCLNCTNNISCNGCETGYTINSTNCTIDCSLITYCTTCNFASGLTCTSCLVGYYPNGNSSPCLYTCGDGIRVTEEQCDDGNLTNNDGCSSTCTLEISFFCVDVAISSGTANQSSCSPCMSNCYNCTNITICIQCGTNYVFNTTSSSCTIDCSSITYCVTCTYTSTLNCQSCSVGYYILGSSCVPRCGDGIMTIEEGCDDGNTANNDGCSPACALEPSFFYCNNQTSNVSSIYNMSSCFPCLANCQNCNIVTDCLACAAGYIYNLVVATVTCDTDCSNLSFCATCTPGVCTSCRAYHLLDGSNNCQPICGDGIVLMVENCDDGNLINGDGCSSSCTTETNFECSNAPLKPSLCSLLFFTITLDSIIKDENKNSVAVIYQLSPSTLPGYQSANWSQIIFQQSTLDVNFTSFSYDPVTGLLTVNAAYNQNINNKELVLGFNFPPTAPFDLIPANQTTTTKLVSSNNLSLQYYSDQAYAQAKLLSMLALVVTCLAILLFLLGYLSAKLVGLELITIFQITFLSLVTLENLSPALHSISFISYSCGYNIRDLVNSASLRIHSRFVPVKFSQSFINNYNLTVIVILLPLLIALVLSLINRFAYKSQHPKLSKYSLLMRGEYVFYGLMFSAYSICVAAGIEVIYFANIAGMMYAGVALSAILLSFFIIYAVLLHQKPEIFGQFSDKFNKVSIIQSHYYCFLLLERIVTSLALLVFMIKPQSAIIMGLLAIQIIVILCKQPYAGERGSLRPVLNLSITLTIQLIILLTPMISSIPSYETYSPIVILVLLVIALLYNIYFFVKECRNKNNQKGRDQLEEEENYMKNELAKMETFQNSFMKAYANLLNNSSLEDNADDGGQPHSPGKINNTSNINLIKKQLSKMKETARSTSKDQSKFQLLENYLPDLELSQEAI